MNPINLHQFVQHEDSHLYQLVRHHHGLPNMMEFIQRELQEETEPYPPARPRQIRRKWEILRLSVQFIRDLTISVTWKNPKIVEKQARLGAPGYSCLHLLGDIILDTDVQPPPLVMPQANTQDHTDETGVASQLETCSLVLQNHGTTVRDKYRLLSLVSHLVKSAEMCVTMHPAPQIEESDWMLAWVYLWEWDLSFRQFCYRQCYCQ